MMHAGGPVLLSLMGLLFWNTALRAADPLHKEIDRLILARAGGQKPGALTDDAEFLRRVTLDLAGRIPTREETRAFLQDTSPSKRAGLVDRLLNGADYPRRMQELFHVMLMERLGDHADWTQYLQTSFAKNKPWDQLVREMLRGRANDEASKGAPFFLSKRLENYGQNPVDHPALARDIGRLFLGIDLRCAQCHDHLFIKDYKQRDFQGLFAFVENAALKSGPTPEVMEKPTTRKLGFQSVFRKQPMETGPRVPGFAEIEVPVFKKGEEYRVPPNPKTRTPGELRFSPLAKLSETLPVPQNDLFNRNIVNRLWFVMMGRGLVHPLDLHHKGNPPSHPELLDGLAREFVAHKYDIKWLLRELALSDTYQRSSILLPGQEKRAPETFLTALEKPLSAEQMLWSMLEATGEKERVVAASKSGGKNAPLEQARQRFLKAFSGPVREAEEEFSPSLKGVLFLENDALLLGWLTPRTGNLLDRLTKLSDDRVAEELYLCVLTRLPTTEEQQEVESYLKKKAAHRTTALQHLAWALLASTEFCLNH